MASAGRQFKSQEEFKKEKELDEARKAGTAPPAVDDDGKMINPHIPEYMSKAPWYIDASNKLTLKHQRLAKGESVTKDWYKRGVKGHQATKFRKGACTNCGAMTHKAKDCLERPRKVGAKFTGEDIAADDAALPELELDYDAKRDRWNGFEFSDDRRYMGLVGERFRILEEERRKLQQQNIETKLKDGKLEKNESDEEDDDSDKDVEGKVFVYEARAGSKSKATVRNLRIREDTAKYLYNLDVNSAFYDPKSRSMRENPLPNNSSNISFLGDNFLRQSGDAQKVQNLTLHAMKASDHGQDIHLQALPTVTEKKHEEFKERKEMLAHRQKRAVLDKYGSQEPVQAPPKELLLAQTEEYVEYSADGRVLKGRERAVPRSKYEEDVFPNNHTAVWGSYWEAGQWGYKCCGQLERNAYCQGKKGIEARRAILREMEDNLVKKQQKPLKASGEIVNLAQSSKIWGEADPSAPIDPKELKKAMKRQAESKESFQSDDRKRKYHSMESTNVTEEDMEAYRMQKVRAGDPMANFKNVV
eukprot:Rmarinus@m.13796